MPSYRVIAVDQANAPALDISSRLRSQIVYFMTPADAPHVPPLQENDFWIDTENATRWYEDGVFEVISPLDEANKTEIELSEEQELLLEWLVMYEVQHLRVEEAD